MSKKATILIPGMEKGQRVDSRVLEERIQKAVHEGFREIEIVGHGQHGMGGRLWQAGDEEVRIRVLGISGQRLGAMGFPNTFIDAVGPASDDVGWLNSGARIVVRGNAGNGAGNAMAQGKIYIAGNIGARGMTMTKQNPRFAPPELWVLGSTGDSFAEFMAGGIAVVCGYGLTDKENVLGWRPCVGMVGGKVFFRGKQESYSANDALLDYPGEEDWHWLVTNMKEYLSAIGRPELMSELIANRDQWQIFSSRKSRTRTAETIKKLPRYYREVWNKELGPGGIIGDLTSMDRGLIPVIAKGELRRFEPLWENHQWAPPCQANCPSGIPVQQRWELIRQNKLAEAVDLALFYTPFPASVCGHLCPNLCMQNCTRQVSQLPPIDISLLGKASLQAKAPVPAEATGKKVAVIGGGISGLSTAWQLWMKGHEPVIYETRDELGGKLTAQVPGSRIPDEVVAHELSRLKENLCQVNLRHPLTREDFLRLRGEVDFVVIAIGAQKPRLMNIPGAEQAISALDFLHQSKKNQARVGEKVVIIGAGNVGCDAAAEAGRLGAREITLIDIQEPASFGKERQAALAAGARFLYPKFTKAITTAGVELTDGELLPADTVIISIGDLPVLDFLPDNIARERGFIKVDKDYRTSDPQVFAVGDVVKPGLLTDAIGAGRRAAETIDRLLMDRPVIIDELPPLDRARVKMEYFDPRLTGFTDIDSCAHNCASCGGCRDCHVCETICPQNAITRQEREGHGYEYVVDAERCIGCGFCMGACPTGVWYLRENSPLD